MEYTEGDNYQQSEGKKNLAATQASSRIVNVKGADRWDIFRRLQALEIECQCSSNQPLLITLNSPTTALQVWSVVRQFSTPRKQLIDWLNNCWDVEYDLTN
ncbi:hypothetical protein NIES4102_20800 [Chondrocystis sp. NIES-4102]|nr:hypothetical protein NIES4102_20800 [Chondrocystis sp. NIES-4102]